MNFAQQPHAVFLVRPSAFGYNLQTSASNTFQKTPFNNAEVAEIALAEFDRMIDALSSYGIDVHVFQDTASPEKPDAIFPNNWISTHADGTIVLYPMMTENRRWERRPDIVETLKANFVVNSILDLTGEERAGKFLEGTGSLVFDHVNRIAYACQSPRTNLELATVLAKKLKYQAVAFNSVDEKATPIYHTNVMMCVGEKFVVLCLDSIRDDNEQEILLDKFAQTGHKIIAVSYQQIKAFAGNMLEVKTIEGEPVVLLSQSAFDILLPGQINAITKFAELLPIKIDTIESVGGGSVRCMIAGIHLPKRNRV